MTRVKIFFILLLLVFSLISVYFISSMGSFEKKADDCVNNGGTCESEPCETLGMKNHVDGICISKDRKVYEDENSFCCIRAWN